MESIMSNITFAIILLPLYFAIPILVLYFVVKLAVKNALKELKNEDIL